MNENLIIKEEAALKEFVFKNLMKNFLPFPLDKIKASQWAHPLKVPMGGKTILYTSYMYQAASTFKTFERLIPTFVSLGSSNILASLGSKLVRTKNSEIQRYESILQNIYRMVKRTTDNVGYLYDEEPYSGSLLYELGFLDEFKTYGSRLYEFLKRKSIEHIVTVDPHTTNSLSKLKDMIQFDIPFSSYLSLIRGTSGSGEFVIHDSCLYSRFLDMHSTVRDLLTSSGLKLKDDTFLTGKTHATCCGAPIGPLDNVLSDNIARLRMESLKSVSENVLVACPLCYSNLSPYGNVKDISEVIR